MELKAIIVGLVIFNTSYHFAPNAVLPIRIQVNKKSIKQGHPMSDPA